MPRMQYSLITETFSLESKTLFKKPTLCQQILGTGRTGGKRGQTRDTQHETQTKTNKQTKIQSCAKTISSRKPRESCQKKKNQLLPELFKILSITKSSSVLDCLPQGIGLINQFFTQIKTILSLQKERIYTSSNELLQIHYQLWEKESSSNYRGYQGPYQYSLPAGYLHIHFPLYHHSGMPSFPEQFLPLHMFIK